MKNEMKNKIETTTKQYYLEPILEKESVLDRIFTLDFFVYLGVLGFGVYGLIGSFSILLPSTPIITANDINFGPAFIWTSLICLMFGSIGLVNFLTKKYETKIIKWKRVEKVEKVAKFRDNDNENKK